MKKLKLKAQELGAREILTREQLKNVLGGFNDDGSGSFNCGKCTIDTYQFACISVIYDDVINCECSIAAHECVK